MGTTQTREIARQRKREIGKGGDSESEECAMQMPQLSEHERMMCAVCQKSSFIVIDKQNAGVERERERGGLSVIGGTT